METFRYVNTRPADRHVLSLDVAQTLDPRPLRSRVFAHAELWGIGNAHRRASQNFEARAFHVLAQVRNGADRLHVTTRHLTRVDDRSDALSAGNQPQLFEMSDGFANR